MSSSSCSLLSRVVDVSDRWCEICTLLFECLRISKACSIRYSFTMSLLRMELETMQLPLLGANIPYTPLSYRAADREPFL